jgi:A/G-specific adenine glycosylase
MERTDGSIRLFRKALISWGRQNGRRYPWRETSDPFKILVAETLLHRTRADSVLPIYQELVHECPNPAAIVRNEQRVRDLVRPLGLNWRTDALIQTARLIHETYGDTVPSSRTELLTLPGVSDYIAGAVRCFSTGSSEVLLDTNIVRVTGRVWGLPLTDGARRSAKFHDLLSRIAPRRHSRELYFAIIDLAAALCRPVEPRCEFCPLNRLCAYAASRGPVGLRKPRGQGV